MRDIDGIDVLIEHLREQMKKARESRAEGIVKPRSEAPGDELPADADLSELESMLSADGSAPVGIEVEVEKEDDEEEY